MRFVFRTSGNRKKVDRIEVAIEVQISAFVVDIGNASGHACREVDADRSKNDGNAARHVFASVVSDSFNDESGARIADAEPFACLAIDVNLACCRTIGDHVPGDDVISWRKRRFRRRPNGDRAARETLADVIVGFPGEIEDQAFGKERAKGLAGDAGELTGHRPDKRATMGDEPAGKRRADRAVAV